MDVSARGRVWLVGGLLAGAIGSGAAGLGCSSGSDFQVAAPDATVDATTDAPSDAGDSASDSGVDAPTDADGGCAKNACGGCALLLNNPGDSCGACGKYACNGKDAVKCADPGKNSCGGCGTLTAKPGDTCGACGKQLCSADGSKLECSDPGNNACGGCLPLPGKPGGSCGGAACGVGTYACKGTDALECKGAATNECGGCGTLAGKVGDACGKCNTGKLVCNGPDALRCNDPILSPATVGTPCSKCGTIKWACNAEGTAIVCPGTDTNACEGCGTLSGVPGADCGTCGLYKCNTGGSDVSCIGPTAGTSCGTCGTSTTLCDVRGVSTKCAKPDDRATAIDLQWTGTETTKFDLSRSVAHAIGYPLVKGGSVYQLVLRGTRRDYQCPTSLLVLGSAPAGDTGIGLCTSPDPACTACVTGIAGCTCAVPSPTDGNVTATLCKGSPKDGPCAVLGSATVLASSFPKDGLGPVTFTFTGVGKLDAGQAVWFQLTNESTQHSIQLESGSGPGSYDAWLRSNFSSAATWVGAGTEPDATVMVLGCF